MNVIWILSLLVQQSFGCEDGCISTKLRIVGTQTVQCFNGRAFLTERKANVWQDNAVIGTYKFAHREDDNGHVLEHNDGSLLILKPVSHQTKDGHVTSKMGKILGRGEGHFDRYKTFTRMSKDDNGRLFCGKHRFAELLFVQ